MCLGELAEVLELRPGRAAVVRSDQRTSTVSLLALDEPVAAGDWVVCHSGFALSRVGTEQAREAGALRSALAAGTTVATTGEGP